MNLEPVPFLKTELTREAQLKIRALCKRTSKIRPPVQQNIQAGDAAV